ncbi:peptidoglycan recognition protein family protein [Paenibacillus sp. LjRoot56]|uniref:peptidoglycan recognition protein family protein n=1 Tax=Paenibacillus sp. LjRoot56 TaxID=3342333 RepID=UPI003ECD1BED
MTIRNLQLPSEIIAKLGVPQIEDIVEKLPINPQNSWARLAGVRNVNDLTTIALHHDAYPKANTTKYTDFQLASNMAIDHINNTKYDATGEGGIPYHIWIRNGRIYQTNDILDRTYGVSGQNGYTVHICVSGEYYKTDVLTDADSKALCAAILMVKSVLPNFQAIKAHKELNPTDCPGYDYKKIIADVLTIENQLEYAKSEEHAKAVAFQIANQILYLANLLNSADTSDGNRIWSREMLLQLQPFMKERGLL